VPSVQVAVSILHLANTKISCEDRAILAFAGFVSFILLLDRASLAPDQDDYQHHGDKAHAEEAHAL
jgi:hypothetical protein